LGIYDAIIPNSAFLHIYIVFFATSFRPEEKIKKFVLILQTGFNDYDNFGYSPE